MAKSIGKEATNILLHINYWCEEKHAKYRDKEGVPYFWFSYGDIGEATVGYKAIQINRICKQLVANEYIEIKPAPYIPLTAKSRLNQNAFYMTKKGIDFCNIGKGEKHVRMTLDTNLTQLGMKYHYLDIIVSYLDYTLEHPPIPILRDEKLWCPHSFVKMSTWTGISLREIKKRFVQYIDEGIIFKRTERNLHSYTLNYAHELLKNYKEPNVKLHLYVNQQQQSQCTEEGVGSAQKKGSECTEERVGSAQKRGSECTKEGVYILETQNDTQENVMTRNSSVKRKNKICYQDSNVIEKEGKYFESNKNLTGASNVTNIQVGKRTPQKLEDVVKRIREKDRGYIPTNEELDKLVDDELYGRNDMTEEITEFDDFCDEDRPRVLVEINTFISRHISKYAWLYDANQSILLLCIQNINTQQFITNKVVKKPLGLTITFLRDFAGSILNKLNEGGLNVRSR